MKIRTQLNLTIISLISVAVLAFVYVSADEIRPRYLEAQEEVLVDFAETIAAMVTRTSVRAGPLGVLAIQTSTLASTYQELAQRKLDARIYALEKKKVDTRIYVTDAQGRVLFDSDNGRDVGQDYSKWRDVRLALQGRYGARTTSLDPTYPDGSTMYVARPITYNGEIVGAVAVGKPTKNLDTFIANLSRNLWLTGAIVAATFALIGSLTYRSLTRPLAKIQQYATDVSNGLPATRPNVGNNEIGAVENALENMRRSLDGKQYIEGYIQSLTHELKAPLAGIRGAAELLREPLPLAKQQHFLNNIHEQTLRLHDLIERLLLLAKLENAETLTNVETVDIALLFGEVAKAYNDYASNNGVTIKVSLPAEALTLEGDRFLLQQAVGNLLKNAVEHATPKTVVTVGASFDGNALTIEVSNIGERIPDFAIDKLFDRFYSLPNRKGQKGSGIGLSFVKEVAKLHNGVVAISNTKPDSVFAIITLPSHRCLA
jgi:two-component system, OmpR family, sensor histidine kinase CreC